MGTLLKWDYTLFEWINQAFTNEVLDTILPYWRIEEMWYPFYIFLIAFMFFNFPWKKVLFFILLILATVGTTDFTGSQVMKEGIERPRPCHVDTQVKARLLVECGSGYSFPSNHAANHMAIATFLIMTIGYINRYLKYFLLIWVLIICYAQIYVGVHYPSDILMGVLLGGIIGYLGGYVNNRFNSFRKWL